MVLSNGSHLLYYNQPMDAYPSGFLANQFQASCSTDLALPQAQITPIHTLPYDILFDIFNLFTLPCPEVPSLSVTFTLSHVCHSWRHVALTSPRLWTDLSIRLPWSRCHPDHILWVQELISRSNEFSLSLQLHIDPFSVGTALSLIISNSRRIRKLSICMIVNGDDKFQRNCNVGMPLLEHFSLSVAESMFLAVSMVPDAEGQSFNLPLRTQRIESDACSLRNLTTLSLKNLPNTRRSPLNPCDLRTVLYNSRNSLQHLEVYDHGINLSHPPAPLSLPNLLSLAIGFVDPGISISDLNQFIRMLRLPNLRTLSLQDVLRFPTLSYPIANSPAHVSYSTDMLLALRQFDTVENLHMSGVKCRTASSAVSLVRSFPKLRSLSLIKCDTNLVFSFLHGRPHASPSPTGSLLEDLALCTIRPKDLVAFLEQRSASKLPKLQSLTITPQCIHNDFTQECRRKWWDAVRSAELTICALARHVRVLKIARQPLDGYTTIDEYELARKAEGYRIGTESLEWVLATLYRETYGAGCRCMSTGDHW
jgi:hypothetical protein